MIKNKKYILVIIVLIGILMITGISYAVWEVTYTQTGVNVVNSTCFKIEFEEENDIKLSKIYPITEEEGMKLIPYTFTIRNVCDTNAIYQINLEELETSLKRLSNEYIKVSLNEEKGKLLNSYKTVEKTILNADHAFKLTTGVLKNNTEKTFHLRIWMDEDTPAIEEVMEATFKGKVSIIVTHKNVIPEVYIAAKEYLDEIIVNVSTLKNEKNEPLTYYYQLNNESEIKSEENTYIFTGLQDGKYIARGRAETKDGIILEEKECEVIIAYEKVYISSTGNDETGNGSKEYPYASLNPAYQKVKSEGEIILLSDIIATETASLNIENKEVTLRSEEDNVYTILKDPSFPTQILDIANRNTVTTTNITFDGNEVISSAALLEVRDSTLNLNEGTTVQKNNNRGRYYEELNGTGAIGGGLFLRKSILNINGADILYNKTSVQSGSWSHGAGLYQIGGILNLISGRISYNENVGAIANEIGGGIGFQDGTFNMSGGTISNNKTPKQGGGIDISTNGSDTVMNMTGGTISNNLVIQNSHGSLGGGIVARREADTNSSMTVYLKGGVIENNTASIGPDIYAYNGAQIIDQR